MPLDLLLTNATVLTMDEDRPFASAVGIEGAGSRGWGRSRMRAPT